MAAVRGICVSERKGTPKHGVPEAELIADWGLRSDAHAGTWHRQVSLLGLEQIEQFRARGALVAFGAFGENLIVDGLRVRTLPVGTRLRVGDALLEVTQIGKECHSHCSIFETMGDCIMPREGIFARVLTGGSVRVGDPVTVCGPAAEKGNER